jgi:hypothetical protein
VVDGRNDTVYQSGERTYVMVEAFDSPGKVVTAMEGDDKVTGSVDLSASPLPDKLPGISACTKADYKFGNGWKYGCIKPKTESTVQGQPKEIGVWIYGDKSDNFVRARLNDSTGQCFQPNLATMDWEGWRFVTSRLDASTIGWWGGAKDGVIHWPLKWETLVLLDSNGGKEQSGTVYVGPLWLMY